MVMTAPRARRGKAQKSLDLIDAAFRILEEIQPASVRAVCYRLFIAGLIPGMEKRNTNRVSVQLTYAREHGIIPWEWIVDETRRPEIISTWTNPEELLAAAVRQYRKDYWKDQPAWIEVFSEKGTVRGTLAPILDKYGITFRVWHGHTSSTAVHDVAEVADASDKRLTVVYVGDRDPSGMHMSERDIPGRLARYGRKDNADVIRIAIAECDTLPKAKVPWFRASDKKKDPRYGWYVKKFGHRCWELDALSPPILRDRLEAAIVSRLDLAAWEHATKIEAAEVESMSKFLEGYPKSRQAQRYGKGKP